jgi:hypothetical protein
VFPRETGERESERVRRKFEISFASDIRKSTGANEL